MRKLALLFLFLCFLGAQLPAQASSNKKEEELLFLSRKAFDDGFYEVSLGMLERFINNFPVSPKLAEARLLMGQCYFNQERFPEALTTFESLLVSPDANRLKDALYYWIGETYFKSCNFSQAAAAYKKVIDEFASSAYLPAAYYSLGWVFFQTAQYRDALRYFKLLEEKFPRHPQNKETALKIIECLYKLGEYRSLKESARDYLKLYANQRVYLAYLYFYLAEADYYLNAWEDALGDYSRCFSLAGDNNKIAAQARLGMGWSNLKLKRYKEAADIFAQIKPDELDKKGTEVYLLGKAAVLSQANQVNEASKIYGELLALTSDPLVRAQAYLGKADCLYDLAQYSQAAALYKEALLKLEKENLPAEITDKIHYNLSWAYLKQGEFREAIKEFRKIATESDDKVIKVGALCQIGDAYQDAGDYTKASESYDIILRDYPDSFYSDYVQYQSGITLLKSGNYDAAVLSFLALEKNYPQSKLLDDSVYALGLGYFQKQDYEASRETFVRFQEELKDSPLRPQALYLLGSSLFNLSRFGEAAEVYKTIVKGYPRDTELVQKAEYEIADCFYQMGDEKEAMSRFRQLRSKYPDSSLTPEVIWWLGEYYYRHNDLKLARRYFSSLAQDFPKSDLLADAFYALGSTYADESRYEEALEYFGKVLGLTKADLSGQAALAIAGIYARQGRAEEAMRSYKDAVNKYPNLANLAYPKIADILYKQAEYRQAKDYYRKSLECVPLKEMPDIQFKLAQTSQALGETDSALEEYLKVTYILAVNPLLSVRALLRVAKIYEERGDTSEALKIYKRVIDMGTEESKFAQERIDKIKANLK